MNTIENEIKVSIIVPIFNVEEYLEECLDSLERQTLKDIEVILVNDGSTDASGNIAEKYVMNDKRFKLVNRDNGGLSAARNTGLSVAVGEYVYFIDSDDYLADNAMEVLYDYAKEKEVDVVKFVAYTFTDHNKDFTWDHNSGYKYNGNYPDVYSGVDILKRFIEYKDIYPSCCLIFTKRSVVENNNLRFVEGIIHEDNLYNFELIAVSGRVVVYNKPLYYRRLRSGSITRTYDYLNRIKSMGISMEKADQFIESHPKVKGEVGDWQQMYFIKEMLLARSQMSIADRYSKDTVDSFGRVKRLFYKYNNRNKLIMSLFFKSNTLYGFARCIKCMVK